MLNALPKSAKVALLALLALAAFLFLPPLIRLVYPGFGGFAPDTINAALLGAFQYFAALTMAYASWRGLFPGLYAYAAECMEGKLLEAITTDLFARLPTGDYLNFEIEILSERRKISTLQFTIRCVRFVFSLLPFFFFFFAANATLSSALTAVPASGSRL